MCPLVNRGAVVGSTGQILTAFAKKGNFLCHHFLISPQYFLIPPPSCKRTLVEFDCVCKEKENFCFIIFSFSCSSSILLPPCKKRKFLFHHSGFRIFFPSSSILLPPQALPVLSTTIECPASGSSRLSALVEHHKSMSSVTSSEYGNIIDFKCFL